MRDADDVALAASVGADLIGAILAPGSRRCVSHDALRAIAAAPAPAKKVAVLAGTPPESIALARELGFVLQFSGGESLELMRESAEGNDYFAVVHVAADGSFDRARLEAIVREPGAVAMFDTKADGQNGGTGRSFAWAALAPYVRPQTFAVAGGLRAENVGECIEVLRPLIVDVAGGIETDGRKDPEKMRAFVDAVRRADQKNTGRG
jgi:phosphoribosylanthranilate isomerase